MLIIFFYLCVLIAWEHKIVYVRDFAQCRQINHQSTGQWSCETVAWFVSHAFANKEKLKSKLKEQTKRKLIT